MKTVNERNKYRYKDNIREKKKEGTYKRISIHIYLYNLSFQREKKEFGVVKKLNKTIKTRALFQLQTPNTKKVNTNDARAN